jgi:hypothetical protein
MKTVKTFVQSSRCSGRNSNRTSPECKSEHFQPDLTCQGYCWPKNESMVFGIERDSEPSNMKSNQGMYALGGKQELLHADSSFRLFFDRDPVV